MMFKTVLASAAAASSQAGKSQQAQSSCGGLRNDGQGSNFLSAQSAIPHADVVYRYAVGDASTTESSAELEAGQSSAGGYTISVCECYGVSQSGTIHISSQRVAGEGDGELSAFQAVNAAQLDVGVIAAYIGIGEILGVNHQVAGIIFLELEAVVCTGCGTIGVDRQGVRPVISIEINQLEAEGECVREVAAEIGCPYSAVFMIATGYTNAILNVKFVIEGEGGLLLKTVTERLGPLKAVCDSSGGECAQSQKSNKCFFYDFWFIKN